MSRFTFTRLNSLLILFSLLELTQTPSSKKKLGDKRKDPDINKYNNPLLKAKERIIIFNLLFLLYLYALNTVLAKTIIKRLPAITPNETQNSNTMLWAYAMSKVLE